MLTPKFLAASVIAIGLASGHALGQAPTRDAETRFVQLDADRNGGVTRAELAMVPDLAQQFEKFDADKDGRLDRAEFAVLIASMK